MYCQPNQVIPREALDKTILRVHDKMNQIPSMVHYTAKGSSVDSYFSPLSQQTTAASLPSRGLRGESEGTDVIGA